MDLFEPPCIHHHHNQGLGPETLPPFSLSDFASVTSNYLINLVQTSHALVVAFDKPRLVYTHPFLVYSAVPLDRDGVNCGVDVGHHINRLVIFPYSVLLIFSAAWFGMSSLEAPLHLILTWE